MESIWQDIRFGARSLVRRPGFSLTAIVTLAIGIGANVAIFTLLHAFLLNPLPFREPDELVHIYASLPEYGIGHITCSYPDYVDWRAEAESFAEMGAYDWGDFTLIAGDAPERFEGARVSYSLFPMLGIEMALGRSFTAADDMPGAPGTAIISHQLWQSRFGADPDILGRPVEIDSQTFTIIGVARPDMRFPQHSDLWLPLREDPGAERDNFFLNIVGRLGPGVSNETALAELRQITVNLAEAYPESLSGIVIDLHPLQREFSSMWSRSIIIFYCIVCLVLLLACANIANLMLSRLTGRQSEIAVRSTLGAGRSRLVRQLLIESLILAGAGGLVGMVTGVLGRNLLLAGLPEQFPYYVRFEASLPVVLAIIAITVTAGIVFGLAPALTSSRPDLATLVQGSGPRTAGNRSRSRLRSGLIIFEVATATVVLIGAGLMLRSFLNARQSEPGFDLDRVVSAHISLPEHSYPEGSSHRTFADALTERIGRIPGIESASLISTLPMARPAYARFYTPEGHQPAEGERPRFTFYYSIQPDLFETLQIPLLQGRRFTPDDGRSGNGVVIVSQAFAELNWPGENPVGKRLKWGPVDSDNPWIEVIGLTGDVREQALAQEVSPCCFLPMPQEPERDFDLVVRTAGDPLELVPSLRTAVTGIDPDLPVYDILTAADVMQRANWRATLTTWLFGVFSTIALILAAVGIYGVISFAVSQRLRELGIRIALGARPADIRGLIMRQTTRLTTIGIGTGLVVAAAGTRVLQSLLFRVGTFDPLTYLGMAAIMLAAALAAGFIPVRRALGADPVEAIRHEQ